MTDAPLLACDDARIDAGGAPLVEGLSLATRGCRVALVGAWTPLFALVGCEAELAAGRVELAGEPATRAVASGNVGLARAEPPLPPRWSALAFLHQSAWLGGLERRYARDAARSVLQALGLERLAGRALGSLGAHERRAVMIAHAAICAPRGLVLETPLGRLDDAVQGMLRDLVERAAEGRSLIFSVESGLPSAAERALVETADDVLVLEQGRLVAQGEPARALEPGRRYLVSVGRHAERLARALGERDCRVTPAGAAGDDAARFVVDLSPEATPDALLALSLEVDAPLVELVPLPRAEQPS
jgi:ABC-2 type transport system ATP-binding protein